MASKKNLNGMSPEERVVWMRVERQLRTAGIELRNVETNLRDLEENASSVEPDTSAYKLSHAALTAEKAQKQAVFDALAAELLADEETRPAAEYTLADLGKSSTALKKGGKKDRRAVGGGASPTLTYRLREMALIDSGDSTPTYIPGVVLNGHVDDREFRRLLSTGTTIQPADVTAALSNIRERLAQLLSGGYSVSLGDMFVITPGLRGTCIGKEADPYRHREFLPVVNVRVMPKFAKEIRKMTTIGPATKSKKGVPMLAKLIDLGTGTSEPVLRAGSVLCVKGEGLDCNPAAEDEGFFFVPKSRPHKERLLSGDVLKEMLKPKRAVFPLPADLPSGATGRLVLRRRPRNSERLLEYVYPEEVTVV